MEHFLYNVLIGLYHINVSVFNFVIDLVAKNFSYGCTEDTAGATGSFGTSGTDSSGTSGTAGSPMGLGQWLISCVTYIAMTIVGAVLAFNLVTYLLLKMNGESSPVGRPGRNVLQTGKTPSDFEICDEDSTSRMYYQRASDPSIASSVSSESVGSTTSSEASLAENDLESGKLPQTAAPRSYDLVLFPDLDTGLFKGRVIIKVNMKEEVKKIRLHSSGLEIDSVKINGKEGKFHLDPEHELLIVRRKSNKKFKEGLKALEIMYHGSMQNRVVGQYVTSYIDEDRERRAVSSSKLQPTNARRVFPCFDEPQLKAEYTVHLLKPRDDPKYFCLSNMPEEDRTTSFPDGTFVHFKRSPKMSTYLLCFVVCDFECTETYFDNSSAGQTPLRVYSTPAQVEKTRYALEVAQGVMEYFVRYFKVEFPLPKLDLIAIPDFSNEAVEQWGLATFRQTELLCEKDKGSAMRKQTIACVVAHVLAHMWLGNLVTMAWWNDLWLSEGLATLMQYKGVNYHHPDWQMMNQFQVDTLHSALALDSTLASHPIIQPVITSDEIAALFDLITYNKGSSVLRMLESAVTEEKFHEGVKTYLKSFAWENAKTDDLWDKLQEQMEQSLNIKGFMDTWTLQKGYPLLTVAIDGSKYIITQERFLMNSEDEEDEESVFEYKWTIPVTYITDQDQTNPKLHWFDHTEESITIATPKAEWVKFNHQQIGLYRVNYPRKMWDTLTIYMPLFKSAADRSHLLEEAFSLAEHGLLSYDIPLTLSKHLLIEEDYVPWSVGVPKLQELRKYLGNSLEYTRYLGYIKNLVTPIYDKLAWKEDETDDHLKRKLRSLIVGVACSAEMVECRKEIKDRFRDWLDDSTTNLPEDLRMIIYKYGIEDGKSETWEILFKVFKTEIDASEKMNLLVALASTKEPQHLKRLLEFGKNEDIIRRRDYFPMLKMVASNAVGTPIVWDYVRDNWQYLVVRFGLNDSGFGALIPAITADFTTPTKLKEVEVFFENIPDEGAVAKGKKIALRTVKNNIRWVERNKETVEKWIRNNGRYSFSLRRSLD